MHIHFYIAPAFIASAVMLMGAAPATAHGSWPATAETQRCYAPPPTAAYPRRRRPQQAPSSALTLPPGPFLQVDPDSYMYPQLPQQPYVEQSQAWRERQWSEREQRAWRDWGQHDRSDRVSREREGRERDWRERQESDSQPGQGSRSQFGSDAGQNAPDWRYRDNRR